MTTTPHSSLLQQQKAFQKTLKNLPVIQRKPLSGVVGAATAGGVSSSNVTTAAAGSSTSTFASGVSLDHLRPDNTETKGQRHLNSYIHAVISFLKLVQHPVTFEEIKEKISVDIQANKDLFSGILRSEKIIYTNGKLQYKTAFNIRTKEDLLSLLRSRFDNGLEYAELKDCCPGLEEMVNALVAKEEVLCIRNKDGAYKALFLNFIKLTKSVDKEFKEMWQSMAVPDELDLQRELDMAGLKSMDVFDDKRRQDASKNAKKKSQRRGRIVKITNVHMQGVIDFSQDLLTSTAPK